jgi:hypothetical protein
MLVQKVSDGSSEAWQELAVGTATQTVVSGLDDLLGRESLLRRGSGAAESEESCDLSHGESELAMQEKVAEETAGVVIATTALQKSQGGLQDGKLGSRQGGLRDGCLFQPARELRSYCGHGVSSIAAGDGISLWRRSGKCTLSRRKTIRC